MENSILKEVRMWWGLIGASATAQHMIDAIRATSGEVVAVVIMTCHWSFTQPRPEPVVDLRLSACVEQSPGARNPHRV
jgi:hypothetical protein